MRRHRSGAGDYGWNIAAGGQAQCPPARMPELSGQFQPLEIVIRPMRLDLDRRPQDLDFEGLAGPVESNGDPPARHDGGRADASLPAVPEQNRLGRRLRLTHETSGCVSAGSRSPSLRQLLPVEARRTRALDRWGSAGSGSPCSIRLSTTIRTTSWMFLRSSYWVWPRWRHPAPPARDSMRASARRPAPPLSGSCRSSSCSPAQCAPFRSTNAAPLGSRWHCTLHRHRLRQPVAATG